MACMHKHKRCIAPHPSLSQCCFQFFIVSIFSLFIQICGLLGCNLIRCNIYHKAMAGRLIEIELCGAEMVQLKAKDVELERVNYLTQVFILTMKGLSNRADIV